jgi:hypothetical protein
LKSCPWCEYNQFSPKCDEDGNCEFKTIGYDKHSILQRIGGEYALLRPAFDGFESLPDEEISRMLDVVTGISIMISRLKVDFDMSEKEIYAELGFKKPSFAERLKVRMALISMKHKRRKSRGN